MTMDVESLRETADALWKMVNETNANCAKIIGEQLRERERLETRIQDLLEANNRYLEEARAARRELAVAQTLAAGLAERVAFLEVEITK